MRSVNIIKIIDELNQLITKTSDTSFTFEKFTLDTLTDMFKQNSDIILKNINSIIDSEAVDYDEFFRELCQVAKLTSGFSTESSKCTFKCTPKNIHELILNTYSNICNSGRVCSLCNFCVKSNHSMLHINSCLLLWCNWLFMSERMTNFTYLYDHTSEELYEIYKEMLSNLKYRLTLIRDYIEFYFSLSERI